MKRYIAELGSMIVGLCGLVSIGKLLQMSLHMGGPLYDYAVIFMHAVCG